MSGRGNYVKRTYGDNNAPGGGKVDMNKVDKSRYDDHSHLYRERERLQKLEDEKKNKNPPSGSVKGSSLSGATTSKKK